MNNKILYLMHKDYPVAIFDADSYGHIRSLKKIISFNRFPVHSIIKTPEQGMIVIQMWEKNRTIPNARQNMLKISECLGAMPNDAYIKSLRVSLNDCYWYKEKNSNLSWKDVNFYDNGFSNEFFLNVIYHKNTLSNITHIPDLTTNGVLEKAWVWYNNAPYLVKRGDFGELSKLCPDKNLLSANEIVASTLGKILKIKIVEYSPLKIGDEMLCICPSFIDDSNTDFITADQLQRRYRLKALELYKALCENGMKEDVDKMIFFDHIIHNTDRHTYNFGILRDAETLKIKGFVPLFDSGSSFGFSKEEEFTKPFYEKRIDQLSLLDENFELPDPKLIIQCIKTIYSDFDIPEEVTQFAINDLKKSYSMYNEVIKTKAKERDSYEIEE